MKYIRFKKGSKTSYGILDNSVVKELKGNLFEEITFSGSKYKLDEITVLSPVEPSKIIAVGLNYLDHIKEFGDRPIPQNPTLFIKLSCTVIGPEDKILIPDGYDCVDYEAELALIISKDCFKVTVEEARDYIFGVTCLNDVTQREVQRIDGQWIRSKNFPTFCPIGPYIVSDLDLTNLNIKSILNGEIKQDSNTKNFIWDPYELISFISQSIPLKAGDVITTGTPYGVGPMYDGDLISIQIEGVGTLTNTIGK